MDDSVQFKLRDRLPKAEASLEHLRASKNFPEAASAWSTYLQNTGNFLHVLEAWCKLTPQRRQWYGNVRREGRKDPLLLYMYQARNAEEHETSLCSVEVPVGIRLFPPADGPIMGYRLQSVYNSKHNQNFDPPAEHDGKPLEYRGPKAVATIYLDYLRSLFAVAQHI